MSALDHHLDDVPGLVRCETTTHEQGLALALEQTHAVYPHDQVYGRFCTVQDHIDCPPEQVFDYLGDVRNLNEWTYSTRDFAPASSDGLYVGWDRLADDTRIYLRVQANRAALTLDYHCAWDQGDELWMIYLYRIIPAELVLRRPGSIVIWTNCRHPYYDRNPRPELAPRRDRTWVGDLWDLFYAGHAIELANLKAILEHRHSHGLPISMQPSESVS
jgi:hypothetical protein